MSRGFHGDLGNWFRLDFPTPGRAAGAAEAALELSTAQSHHHRQETVARTDIPTVPTPQLQVASTLETVSYTHLTLPTKA